jgi:hypothetical protein
MQNFYGARRLHSWVFMYSWQKKETLLLFPKRRHATNTRIFTNRTDLDSLIFESSWRQKQRHCCYHCFDQKEGLATNTRIVTKGVDFIRGYSCIRGKKEETLLLCPKIKTCHEFRIFTKCIEFHSWVFVYSWQKNQGAGLTLSSQKFKNQYCRQICLLIRSKKSKEKLCFSSTGWCSRSFSSH